MTLMPLFSTGYADGEAAGDSFEVGGGLRDGDAVFENSEDLHPSVRAVFEFRCGYQRHPEFSVAGEFKFCRHDADDGGGFFVDAHLMAEDAW